MWLVVYVWQSVGSVGNGNYWEFTRIHIVSLCNMHVYVFFYF